MTRKTMTPAINYCETRIKVRFWPRVVQRIGAQEITIDSVRNFLRTSAEEEGIEPSSFDGPEFASYLGGKLGLV